MEESMWEIEDENYSEGFEIICGVDEAGGTCVRGGGHSAEASANPRTERQ